MSENKNFEFGAADKGMKLVKYLGFDEVVTIPAKFKDLPVTEIGKECFYGCDNLTTVNIPDSVEKIGYAAFKHCHALRVLNVPASVKVIADDAFDDCDNLALNFSAPVKFGKIFLNPKFTVKPPTDSKNFKYTIGVEINSYTGSETSVTIPAMIDNLPVTKIGESVFEQRGKLTEILLPNSITEIGGRAFYYCHRLTEIKIPDSVKQIGASAFSHCINLKKIELPEGLIRICQYAFCDCRRLKKIKIPASVTEIGFGAFEDCPAKITYLNKNRSW